MFLPGMTFLAENPEAFGFISDARPLATEDGNLLIAANGAGGVMNAGGIAALPGAVVPTFTVETPGVDGLIDEFYGTLVRRTDRNHCLLVETFGESEGPQEHPIPRYAAALAQVTALTVFTEEAVTTTKQGRVILPREATAARLTDRMATSLATLGEVLAGAGKDEREEGLLDVSFAAVRLTDEDDGSTTVDIFSAGDFKVYLLDANGLCPLWTSVTPAVAPRDDRPMDGCTLTLRHPDPYAILLLSDSACAPDAAESRRIREEPGLMWRYRMRLEESLLRLVTAAGPTGDLGDFAARYYTGRAHGRDSASGAMILRPRDAREAFRIACRTRLNRLEGLVLLLPDGYDPMRVPPLEPRADTERAYLRALLAREEGLVERVGEALWKAALEKLHRGLGFLPRSEVVAPGVPSVQILEPDEETLAAAARDAEACPPPANVPDYHRLSFQALWQAYRLYDRENDDDRARITENRRALYEQFSENWVTLRPLFALENALNGYENTAHAPDDETLAYRAACDRDYLACRQLNARLGVILNARRSREIYLDTLLTEGLATLRATRDDRLNGRADDARSAAFFRVLSENLSEALKKEETALAVEGDHYRRLHATYVEDRESLLRRDLTAPHGMLAVTWPAVCDGTLAADRWLELCESIGDCLTREGEVSAHERADYIALLETLRRISLGTGLLCTRVRERAADRRMARELATRVNLQLDCLRAAAYQDPDWGAAASALMTEAQRSDYAAMVARWEEALDIRHRRKEAYEEYRAMYEAFVPLATRA